MKAWTGLCKYFFSVWSRLLPNGALPSKIWNQYCWFWNLPFIFNGSNFKKHFRPSVHYPCFWNCPASGLPCVILILLFYEFDCFLLLCWFLVHTHAEQLEHQMFLFQVLNYVLLLHINVFHIGDSVSQHMYVFFVIEVFMKCCYNLFLKLMYLFMRV